MALAFDDAVDVALTELAAFGDRLRSVGDRDWKIATGLPGWDVEALVRHVAAVAWQQAEAFHRARLPTAAPPAFLEVVGPVADLPAAVDRAGQHLAAGFRHLDGAGDPPVPLPFATLPASLAIHVVVVEYGFHRQDLDTALGLNVELTAEVASTVVELLGGMLPLFAGAGPDRPVAFRLRAGSGATTTLAWRDGAWQAVGIDGEIGETTCTIEGSDAALALFSMGRIGPSHASLTVDDPASLAPRFKEFFPGP